MIIIRVDWTEKKGDWFRAAQLPFDVSPQDVAWLSSQSSLILSHRKPDTKNANVRNDKPHVTFLFLTRICTKCTCE